MTAEVLSVGCWTWGGDEEDRDFVKVTPTVRECVDGRTLFWSSVGWGYLGEVMRERMYVGDPEVPKRELETCSK